MKSTRQRRPVGRPSDPTLATNLLDAGWQMFLERGVEPVAVEAIAARAGVSKATFYKHFPDKTALFEEAVLREMERIEAAQKLTALDDTRTDLADRLRRFGIGLMSFLFDQSAVDFYNALSAELARHKTLARRFYELGPGRTRANLAAILVEAECDGELVISDPEEAAEHLIGLWQGISQYQLSLGISVNSVRASIPKRVDAGIRVFLAAYGPDKPNQHS
jgi:TetR/AcrR family transcriptional repressor of mexJK operon